MRFLVWALRAFLFFALFAFALNNQQPATLHWFFGYGWSAPLVIVVLAAFAAGAAVGVLGMAPSWWRERRRASAAETDPASPPAAGSGPAASPAAAPAPDHPTLPDGI